MFRFLITGACTVLLTATSFAIAGAADTTTPGAVTVATAAISAAPAAEASTVRAAAVEAVAPTAGADLAMWGQDPSSDTQADSNLSGSRLVRRFADGIIQRSAVLAVNLTRNAMRFLGVRYVFGGTSTNGFDCSGYVQHVFALLGVHLPRTADEQYVLGKRVVGKAMAPGDLVFFQTYAAGASHVGIYLGNDRFVHASSSRGVTVSSLHERYWSVRYLGAKRLI